jgi:hypothetical protein
LVRHYVRRLSHDARVDVLLHPLDRHRLRLVGIALWWLSTGSHLGAIPLIQGDFAMPMSRNDWTLFVASCFLAPAATVMIFKLAATLIVALV